MNSVILRLTESSIAITAVIPEIKTAFFQFNSLANAAIVAIHGT